MRTPVLARPFVLSAWLVAAAVTGATFAVPAGAAMPGTCTVIHNDYGPWYVSGANVFGNQISAIQPGAAIQLGSLAGNAASYFQLDCNGIDVSNGNQFKLRSGNASQRVVLRNTKNSQSLIDGEILAQSGAPINTAGGIGPDIIMSGPPPFLEVIAGNGIVIGPTGLIDGPSGLVVAGLSDWTTGESLVNQGTLDGGTYLELHGRKIQGGGAFIGDEIVVSTLTVANNPVNGAFFLSNGLQLFPGPANHVNLTLHAYGASPQVLNIKINGDGDVWMPSAWEPGSTVPPNNAVVPKGGTRAAGVPEPSYGGGSMIVQATGNLRVVSGPTNDFVFPGAIVMKSLGTLDLNGVVINQGWTTSGQQFQGVFFEATSIVSPAGNIQVLTNNPNWINFSTYPAQHVRTWSLSAQQGGGAYFDLADQYAPHLNTYSTTVNAAANGQCWTCLINFSPIFVY